MKRLSKRIISSVLTGTMLLSLLGGSALAVEPEGGPEEEVRSGQPVMSDVVSIQAYTEETETGNELKQIEIVYEEGTDLSGLNGESYLLEGRGPQDEEFTEIQIQEVTVHEESALLGWWLHHQPRGERSPWLVASPPTTISLRAQRKGWTSACAILGRKRIPPCR